MSQFPSKSLCLHAVCCVCQKDKSDGPTHPSKNFAKLLLCVPAIKTSALVFLWTFQNKHIWMSHVTFYLSNWPLSLAYSQWPPGPLLPSHRWTRPLLCQMRYSKLRSAIHWPWQIPRPSLLPSTKLDSQMHARPSHAKREAMMGLFLPRTMAHV